MSKHAFIFRILAAVLVCCSWSTMANASPSIFEVGGSYVAPSKNDADGISTEISRSLAWLTGNLPIPFGDGNAVIIGLKYEGQFVSYKDFTPALWKGQTIKESDLPDELHVLDLSASMAYKFSDHWRGIFRLAPGLHSDFKEIDGEDLVWSGSALANWQFSGKNTFGFGLGYSDTFGVPQAYPIIALDWRFAENWHLDMLLPQKLDLSYTFNERWKTGASFILLGYQYRLTEDAPWNDSVVRYNEMRGGLYGEYSFGPRSKVRFSVGTTFAQKLELRDEDNDEIIYEGEYENAPYFSMKYYMPL